MRQDAWRAYAEIALGLTEASRKRASKVAKELLGKGGATAEQVQAFADDLFKAGASNREVLASVVRAEVDRTLTRVGLAKAEEVATLATRVKDLETQLAARGTTPVADTGNAVEAAQAAADAARKEARKARGDDAPSAVGTPVRTVAKKTVAKKAVAKKTTTALEPVGTVEAAAAEIAKPAPAKKAAAKSTVAKKTAAPAKKATKRATGGAQ
jgi:polyhydroxyalkanoate synthesis regulator phasin